MIYVASSWKNERHGEVVQGLRAADLQVYDFKEPTMCFKWTDVADREHGCELTPAQYVDALNHPLARAGFLQDVDHLLRATTVIMVLPCGNSAHLELGFALGLGKRCAILLPDPVRDMDLMHLTCSHFFSRLETLTEWAKAAELKAHLDSLRPKPTGAITDLN